MLEKFKQNFAGLSAKIQNLSGKPRFLLAVSGGIDSVVMADLFHDAGYDCSVAHCNFKLRGDESEADELFVKKLSENYGFHFHSSHFHTEVYASNHGISIQMAARDLRYEWFNTLINAHSYSAVAVAHHANDVAETLLLNLTRGTGIAGMHGISPLKEKVLRPLLFANREEIENYALKKKLLWREDSSNFDEKYQRNKIRKSVLPVLNELNPSIIEALVKHANLMSKYEKLLLHFIFEEQHNLVDETNGGAVIKINMEKLDVFPDPGILLFHLIGKYGFNGEVCEEIISSQRSGAEFFAAGYKLVIGRKEIFLLNRIELESDEVHLLNPKDSQKEFRFGSMQISKITGNAFSVTGKDYGCKSVNVALIDDEKLKFPLTVRHWRKGDHFFPLGMKGRKLLSDYFIDEKINPAQKELIYLLLSGDEIVWVIGHRIDERFKLTDSTTTTRSFTWQPQN